MYPCLLSCPLSYSGLQDPDLLVQFFLAFLYGTPTAVGWDPTMTYIKDTDPPQYRIVVNNAKGVKQVYKTLELKSSVGAEVLRGRGTRVWRAIRCHPTNLKALKEATEVALKDCWVDQSRQLEGDVIVELHELVTARIKDLKEQIRDLGATTSETVEQLRQSLDAAEALEACLPIPVSHGVVSWNGQEPAEWDQTLDRDTVLKDGKGENVYWEYIFQEKKFIKVDGHPLDKLQDQLKGEHRSTYEYLANHRELILYDAKYHYRLVYGDVCTSLYQVKLLESIFLHLSTITRGESRIADSSETLLLMMTPKALRGLHELGWVHRDISAGNILVTAKGHAKLSDWEYAKEYDTHRVATAHDIRTVSRVAVFGVHVTDNPAGNCRLHGRGG